MFFDKKWEDVSDEDVKKLASTLAKDMGGWLFHQKLDLSRPTPHINVKRTIPNVMKEWVERNRTDGKDLH